MMLGPCVGLPLTMCQDSVEAMFCLLLPFVARAVRSDSPVNAASLTAPKSTRTCRLHHAPPHRGARGFSPDRDKRRTIAASFPACGAQCRSSKIATISQDTVMMPVSF